MTPLRGLGERVHLVAVTVVVTSLAWIAGLAVWLNSGGPGAQRLVVSAQPQPAEDRRADAAPAGVPVIPVEGVQPAQLVDTFAQARAAGARLHDAIDIPAPLGTPVRAAAPGRVEKLFLSKDGGNTVYVRSPDGAILYYYAHLASYAAGLAEGARVDAGAPIGTVGATGNADPAVPHLHFAMMRTRPDVPWYEHAFALNPYPWLTQQRP